MRHTKHSNNPQFNDGTPRFGNPLDYWKQIFWNAYVDSDVRLIFPELYDKVHEKLNADQ